MPGPACPVCISRSREEIERRLKEGTSLRAISSWLQQATGERIGKGGIYTHSKSHMVVQTELGKQMAACPVVPLPTATLSLVPAPLSIDTPLTPLDTLVKTQSVALRIVEQLAEKLLSDDVVEGFDGALSQTQAMLLVAALKEARTSAKNRHELVHGKKLIVSAQVEAHTALKSMSTDDLAKKREELRKRGGA